MSNDNNNDIEDDQEIDNVINIEEEKEKWYIQSLKSSLYSENFQKDILKKVLLAEKYILKWDLKYIDIVKEMELDISLSISKSNITENKEYSNLWNKDWKEENIFFALKKLLNWIINENIEIWKKIITQLIKILNENIEKIEKINTKKREIIDITLKAQSWDSEAWMKIIELVNSDIERYAKKIASFNAWKRKFEFEMLCDDLYQEWLVWVMRWVQKFSPKKSDNVREYMKFWINQSMLSYITRKVHTIRIPVHVRQLFIKITRMLEEYWGTEEFNIKSIAENLWLSEDKVTKIINYWKLWQTIFLSDFIWDDDKEMSLDSMPFMEDLTIGVEESILQREELVELQDSIKEILTSEEKLVIIHRYWLFWADKLLLKDLWEKLWKTEERVRQIEARALQMLSVKYFDKKYWKDFREKFKDNVK